MITPPFGQDSCNINNDAKVRKKLDQDSGVQKFIWIRLPEEIGDTQDVSAFRAYSTVSLSDHCLVKYWPQGDQDEDS